MKTEPLLGVDDTTEHLRDTPPGPRGRWSRRAGVALLVLIIVAAALGLLGPMTGDKTASASGYTLSVEHPRVTRAGQPAPLQLRIESSVGFEKAVQVRLCAELFDDMDFQNWYPNPAAETAAPSWIDYEFDPPVAGDVLEIHLDAREAPGQFGEVDDCTVSVLVEDEPVVSTSFNVWRLP